MRTPARTYGAYEADPAPYLAFLAIAASVFISAPAVLGAIALARLAQTARCLRDPLDARARVDVACVVEHRS